MSRKLESIISAGGGAGLGTLIIDLTGRFGTPENLDFVNEYAAIMTGILYLIIDLINREINEKKWNKYQKQLEAAYKKELNDPNTKTERAEELQRELEDLRRRANDRLAQKMNYVGSFLSRRGENP